MEETKSDKEISIERMYEKQHEGNIVDAQLIDSKMSKNICSSEEKELCIFLYTIFQHYLEKAIELMSQDDPEKKTKAKKILLSLIENSFINYIKANKIIYTCLNGILNFYLGNLIFNSEDQSSCEEHYLKSIDYFNTLPTVIKIRYINYYQEIYNNVGIIFYNKGNIKKGLQYLGKAEQMYKVFNDLNTYNITNSFDKFMINCSRNDDSVKDKLEFFNFFIDGGLNRKTFEHNYTLTIFYYAQAFTKLNFRNKAIKYCSITLKRQIENNEFDLKDVVNNCINLSEFYIENQHYAQAEYILIAALSLLPQDLDKKKKLRATLQNMLGHYFAERLKFAVQQTSEQVFLTDNDDLNTRVNKRIIVFTNLNLKWPKIEDIKNIEQAKQVFRLGNTQLKRSVDYFKLDGFVSEHIQITRELSNLYKYLTFFETDNNRIFGMMERRIDLLEPIIGEINQKHYSLQWQELSLETAQIYCEYFERKIELLREKEKKQKYSHFAEINKYGEKAVLYYKNLLFFLQQEYDKAEEKTLTDLVTIITIKLHVARILSKLIYKEVKKRVEYLRSSYLIYEEVYVFLKSQNKDIGPLREQMTICDEMIHLLPVKINKINNGEEIF